MAAAGGDLRPDQNERLAMESFLPILLSLKGVLVGENEVIQSLGFGNLDHPLDWEQAIGIGGMGRDDSNRLLVGMPKGWIGSAGEMGDARRFQRECRAAGNKNSNKDYAVL